MASISLLISFENDYEMFFGRPLKERAHKVFYAWPRIDCLCIHCDGRCMVCDKGLSYNLFLVTKSSVACSRM